MSNLQTIKKVLQNKNEFYFLAFIFILALALRLTYVWILKTYYFFYGHPSSDVTYYFQWANEIALGNWLGNKTFFSLPLFPYFLAALKGLCLGNLLAMRFAYLLLGCLNCILVYFVARRPFGENVARLAAILAATNFTLIHFDWLMMPVTLLVTLSLIIILSLTYSETLQTKREWFILGLLIGLATLGDGKFSIFFFLLSLYLLKKCWPSGVKEIQRVVVPLLCGALIVIGGVALRNKVVGGSWVAVTAQAGLDFYVGNHPGASGVFESIEVIRPTHGGQDEDQRIVAEAAAKKSLTDKEISHFWFQKAFDFITHHPSEYVMLLGKKFLLFFTDTEYAHDIDMILQRPWREKLDVNPFFLVCPLAFLGMGFAYFYYHKNMFINLLIVSELVGTLIRFLSSRHQATILPLLLIYEAYVLCWIVEQIRSRTWERILVPVGWMAVYFLLFPPQLMSNHDFDFLNHVKSGPIYDQRKEYTKAQHEYSQALSLNPTDSNTLYNLGTSYLGQEKIPPAQYYFKKTLEINPLNVDALFNLGYTYEITHEWDSAIETYQRVLRYQPESLDVYYRIGSTFQQKGDCRSAKKYYSDISERRPLLKKEMDKLISQCR